MTEEERQTIVGIGGKLIDGLRASPALLALIVLNIILMGAVFWSVRQERSFEFELTKLDREQLAKMSEMLAACQDRNTK